MCGAMGALYAGVMDGDLCGCGSINNFLEVDKDIGECLTECTGDDGRTEMCGGSASFGLFEIFYRESVVGGGELCYQNKYPTIRWVLRRSYEGLRVLIFTSAHR